MLWILLDGIGHPHDAPADSPWAQPLPTLERLIASGQVLDATLGVAGLPQSGTGQSSWLCGLNAAQRMGRHYGPQPGPTLKGLLRESLPVRLARAARRVELLNAYPQGYFSGRPTSGGPRSSEDGPRHGCIAQSVLYAGLSLNPAGLPLLSPLLGLGYAPPFEATHTLEQVQGWGTALGRAARGLDLGLLDLWLSDAIGHLGADPLPHEVREGARRYLRHLDAFVVGVQASGCPLILSSDHGNFEDLRVRTHTYARVPLCSSGLDLPPCRDIAEGGRAIAAVLGV